MTITNDTGRSRPRRLVCLALSLAMLLGCAPALGDADAPAAAEPVLTEDVSVQTAAPESTPETVPAAEPTEEAVAVEQTAINANVKLSNGYGYQLIAPGASEMAVVRNSGDALPSGTVLTLSGSGITVSPASVTLSGSQSTAFTVRAASEGVHKATLTAKDDYGSTVYTTELLFISVSDEDDFAIPLICSDLSGSVIKKLDFLTADDPTTRLEINQSLVPAGSRAAWSISNTVGQGNATIRLTGYGSSQQPPIMYTKSNIADVEATITLKLTLPAGEVLTREIPVEYEVRSQVPTDFASSGEVLVTRVGYTAQVDLTTSEDGSALTDGMKVTAEFKDDVDAQLTMTSFDPDTGFGIGATKSGVYKVQVTAVSDVPGVIDGRSFTKDVWLIVADAANELPDELFSLTPSSLSATLYDGMSMLGSMSVEHYAPVESSSQFTTTWKVTDASGNAAAITADGSQYGNSADLRASGAVTSGAYTVTATVNYKGAHKTLTAPLYITSNAPRIDGLRDSYDIPYAYSDYVISAPGVVVSTASGVWKDYESSVTWKCEAADSKSAAAFASITTDAYTGYTRFTLPRSRKPGSYFFTFTAQLADGRTASETIELGVQDAYGVVPTPVPTPDPNKPREGTITANRVNVRSGAGTEYRSLGVLVRGDEIIVTDWSGEWFRFTYDGQTAYIKGEFVEFNDMPTAAPTVRPTTRPTATPTPRPTTAPTAQVRMGTVTADRVNVRAGAGSSYTVLTKMDRGDRVSVVDWSGDWYKLAYNGGTAFISADYVKLDTAATTAPTVKPTATPGTAVQWGRITLDSGTLRLRETASNTATVLTRMPNGAAVEILGSINTWYKVRYDGHTGYASRDYITLVDNPSATVSPTMRPTTTPTARPTATPTAAPSTGTVKLSSASSRLVVRSGPGRSYSEVTRLKNGDVVTVLGSENGFYKISFSGTTGYASMDYITLGAATAAPTNRPTTAPTARPTATPTPSARYATVIKADGLPLHETEQGATVRVIPNYGVVQVLNVYGAWSHVVYDGHTGYVENKYLKSGIISPDLSDYPTARVTLSSSSSMNMRKSASTNSDVVTTMPNGAIIEVLQSGNTWCKVRYNGNTGYCMTKYLIILG